MQAHGTLEFSGGGGAPAPGSVTNTQLAAMPALTVKANPTNASGQPQDVSASADGQVFQRNGTTLDFSLLRNVSFQDNTVALARLVNAGAQFDFIMRNTAGAGAWQDATLAQVTTALNSATGFVLKTGDTMAGALIINASGLTPANAPPATTYTHIYGATGALARSTIDAFGNVPSFTTRRANGTAAVPTTIVSGDLIASWGFAGYDGGAYGFSSTIDVLATQNWVAGSARGTSVSITGIPNGSTTREILLNMSALGCVVGNSASFQGAGTLNAIGGLYANANLVADTNGLLRTRSYTVGTLPAAAGVAGALARVSDALAAPVYNAAAVGGGTVFANVCSNGTTWLYC